MCVWYHTVILVSNPTYIIHTSMFCFSIKFIVSAGLLKNCNRNVTDRMLVDTTLSTSNQILIRSPCCKKRRETQEHKKQWHSKRSCNFAISRIILDIRTSVSLCFIFFSLMPFPSPHFSILFLLFVFWISSQLSKNVQHGTWHMRCVPESTVQLRAGSIIAICW